MNKCEDQYCNNGGSYWSLTQMCGQDQMWRVVPQPGRVMFGREGGPCYCECASGVRYCYSPVCTDTGQITKVITKCTQDKVGYQQFVTVSGSDGGGNTTCRCPCPYPMCTSCGDPVVAEYVREVCKEMYYWEGYPVVMAIQGTPCTCLCPARTATAMLVGAPAAAEGEPAARRLHDTGAGDQVLAAGLALEWRPAPVLSRAVLHPLTPVTALNVEAEGDAVTLAPDQLVLTAGRRLKPALALEAGDRLATPDGGEQRVRRVEPLPRYSAPLPFLALAHDPPDASLADRLLALNRLVVGDYSLQLFALLGRLPAGLLSLTPAL